MHGPRDEGPNSQPHWQARKVLNSGGSGEDDVEVGLFRGLEFSWVAAEPEQASRVAASPSEVIFFVRGRKIELGDWGFQGFPMF